MWNVPIEETIDIRTNTLFENTERAKELLKNEFKEFSSLVMNSV